MSETELRNSESRNRCQSLELGAILTPPNTVTIVTPRASPDLLVKILACEVRRGCFPVVHHAVHHEPLSSNASHTERIGSAAVPQTDGEHVTHNFCTYKSPSCYGTETDGKFVNDLTVLTKKQCLRCADSEPQQIALYPPLTWFFQRSTSHHINSQSLCSRARAWLDKAPQLGYCGVLKALYRLYGLGLSSNRQKLSCHSA